MCDLWWPLVVHADDTCCLSAPLVVQEDDTFNSNTSTCCSVSGTISRLMQPYDGTDCVSNAVTYGDWWCSSIWQPPPPSSTPECHTISYASVQNSTLAKIIYRTLWQQTCSIHLITHLHCQSCLLASAVHKKKIFIHYLVQVNMQMNLKVICVSTLQRYLPLLRCTWIPVTLGSPSVVTKFIIIATYAYNI